MIESNFRYLNFIIILITFLGCNHLNLKTDNNSAKPNINAEYIKSKSVFPNEFIAQFPDSISSPINRLSTSYSPDSNKIYFFLYEYEKTIAEIDSVKKNLLNNSISNYSAEDSCLLVINEKTKLFNDPYFEKNCLATKYPVPFFYKHKGKESKNLSTKLDESYYIYILGADTTDFFNFNVRQNTGNFKWKNGYSRGIAYSYKEKTIIYWSIAW